VARPRPALAGAAPVVSVLGSGACFAAFYAVGARACFAKTLRETVPVIPARLRPIARRVLMLPEPARSEGDDRAAQTDA